MRKFFSTFLGMFLILLIAAGIVGFIFWSKVPDMLATDLANTLKVAVRIDDMGLGWNKIDIEKVEIGNTPQSVLSKAFACNLIRVRTPFHRYLNNHIVIEEIQINDIYLGLEFDSPTSTKGNWTEIMKNLQSSSSKTSSTRTVLIQRLVLNRINVDVLYRKDGGKVKHLPPIDQIIFTDISSEGGLPMDQLMNSVLGKMLRSVFEKENLKNMLQELIQTPNGLQKYIQPFKGFFNAEFQPDRPIDLGSA